MPIVLIAGVLLIAGGLFMMKSNLIDISPAEQGGNFKTDFDEVFLKVSKSEGIPFALLKAIAIRESSLDPKAYRMEPDGRASFGLMQVLWWPESERFENFGFPDANLGSNAEMLFDPMINVTIGAKIMKDNLRTSGQNLRDAVNMYNTGVKESKRIAPHNYVDNVLAYYQKITRNEV